MFYIVTLGVGCGCSLRTAELETLEVILDRVEHTGWDSSDTMYAICKNPRRQTKLRLLLEGWGRRSEEYDLAVWRLLVESGTPSICSMDEEMASLFLARVREDPTLLRQWFWNVRWKVAKRLAEMGIVDSPNTEPVLVAIARDKYPLECLRYQKVYRLIMLASMLDRPELVTNVTWNSLDEDWRETVLWFEVNAPFFYFDPDQGIYVLDREAAIANKPVAEHRQRSIAAPPATRLPPRTYPVE